MEVELHRGTVLESRHRVHVAVVDAGGLLVAQAGDPEYRTFWRSAAKPFQAVPLIEDGPVERFGLSRQDPALARPSHSSGRRQWARARDFLRAIGGRERALLRGPPRPLAGACAQ